MKKRIAINGFGRIGRIAYRLLLGSSDYEVVAINSRGTAEENAYLLKFDENITVLDDGIMVDTTFTKVLQIDDPEKCPWRELNVDLVLECTGAFTKKEDAYKHILAGAKHVIISAPGKDEMKTVVYGVNENILSRDDEIISSASCTTNCLAPVLKIIEDNIGIESGFMSTIHAYTNDQNTLDGSHKKGIKSRRGRTAASNIIPTSTGAAKSIGVVIPTLSGKMDGVAYRVPVIDGSMVDVTLTLSRATSVDERNDLFRNNMNEVLDFTVDPIVSSDVIGRRAGSVVDVLSTNVADVDGTQMVKIVAWYDNEMGYTAQMVRTAKYLMEK